MRCIDVNERLPEIKNKKYDCSDNVLVWCNDELMVMCYCFIYDNDNIGGYVWCNCHGIIDGDAEFDDNYYPTHWMHLPKKHNS